MYDTRTFTSIAHLPFTINLKRNYGIIKENIQTSNIEIDFNNISLIYVDPPYLKYDMNKLLFVLKDRVKKGSIIGIETSVNDNFDVPNKLKIINKKKYGKTNISILVLS